MSYVLSRSNSIVSRLMHSHPALAPGASSPLAHERRARWNRGEGRAPQRVEIFHSTQSVHLPTAETMGKGEFEFEIWHRFLLPVSSGLNGLWGLDGPALIRFALAYGVSERLVLSLGRSNNRDNVDFKFRYKALEIPNENLPTVVGLQAGVGWNTDVFGRSDTDSRNFQYYAQLIVNSGIGDRLAVGVVPSFLTNIDIDFPEAKSALGLGLYGHYYATPLLAFIAEAYIAAPNPSAPHNIGTVGIQLETGGHFFKLFVTNSSALNSSQFLGGALTQFTADELMLGFNITRVLR